MAAHLTLDQLVLVRIQPRQQAWLEYEVCNGRIVEKEREGTRTE